MDRIRRQKKFLKAITKVANRNMRKDLIKHAKKDQVKFTQKQCPCLTHYHGQIKTIQTNFEENWQSSCIA